MKKLLFAAMLTASSVALAQTTTDAQGTGAEADASVQTDVSTQVSTSNTATTTDVQATAGMDTGTTVAPGNTNPETDARGIPVISDPAAAPAGANQATPVPAGAQAIPNPNQTAVFSTRASTESYPPCSRTVTDNCVQSYERGSRSR